MRIENEIQNAHDIITHALRESIPGITYAGDSKMYLRGIRDCMCWVLMHSTDGHSGLIESIVQGIAEHAEQCGLEFHLKEEHS